MRLKKVKPFAGNNLRGGKTTPPRGHTTRPVNKMIVEALGREEEKTTPPCGHPSGPVNKMTIEGLGREEEKTTPPCGHPSRGGDFTRVPNVKSEHKSHSVSCVQSPPPEGCPKDGVEKSARSILPSESNPKHGVAQTVPFTYINNIPIYRYFTSNLPSNHNLAQRARELRKAGNLAEILFWKRVHKSKFYKIDFDRQRVIGSYIVDFYVKTLSLIVEIDGLSHVGKEVYDAQRQSYLESLGLIVYRIKDTRILKDIDNVMLELEVFVCNRYGRPQ